MKKIILLAFLTSISFEFAFSQRNKIDSLNKLISSFEKKENYSGDTNYIKLLQKIALVYNTFDSDSTNIIANKILHLSSKINYISGEAYGYYIIGSSIFTKGRYIEAIENYLKAQKLFEQINDIQGISWVYNDIGYIYCGQNKYSEAIEYMNKALKYKLMLGNKLDIANTLSNIAWIYYKQKLYIPALNKNNEALMIREEVKDSIGLVYSYNNAGWILLRMNKTDSAEFYLKHAYVLNGKNADKYIGSEILQGMAECNLYKKNYSLSLSYATKAWKMANEIKYIEKLSDISSTLSNIYEATGNYKEAFEFQKLFKVYSDSMINTENNNKTQQLQLKYEYEKKEQQLLANEKQKDAENEKKIQRSHFIRNSFIGAFFILIFITGLILKNRKKIKEKNALLEIKNTEINSKNIVLNQQREEIQSQADNLVEVNELLNIKNSEILIQKNLLQKSHNQITASITYASRIQNALLPSDKILKDIFPEHFILLKPRDIVSGDFYYCRKINEMLIIAAADCTGHGVPGAFMSMLGISFLNEIVTKREITKPSQVLDELRKQVKTSLQQTGNAGENQDGMDIALCVINTANLQGNFAGAHNPLLIIKVEENGEKIQQIIIPSDKMPIGIHPRDHVPFTNNEFQLQKNDLIYLFSDGFESQFGGENNEKFKTKKLKELLAEISQLPMNEQKLILEKRFNDWKSRNDQTDDVLVVGIKI